MLGRGAKALGIATVAVALLCAALTAAASPIANGYRDQTYPSNTGGDSRPTAEKPESKLWFNDGLWWASMWSTAAASYRIHKLNTATESWTDTGVAIDGRLGTKADALWDGTHLYVASHVWAQPGTATTSANRGRLYRFSYSAATDTYTLDSGFPVEVTGGTSETLVIAKDGSGVLWVTYTQDQDVMINHSLGADDSWGTPFILPVASTSTLTTDDICSIVAYDGHVGVMWSHQGEDNMYFSSHADGDSDATWSARVTAYGVSSDDHISLKSVPNDPAGKIFAAIKTSVSNVIVVLRCQNNANACNSASDWVSAVVYNSTTFDPTRPILALDTSNRELYVFSGNTTGGSEAIYYKKTSMDSISFTQNTIGTPIILSTTDDVIDDVTTTKQNFSATTSLVVVASDRGPHAYFHNHVGISAPGGAPTISSFNPTSGAVATPVTISGTNFTGATSVKFNGTTAGFTVDNSSTISTSVPAGATSGAISVTTPAGTATSATNFTVTGGAPTVTSFDPTSGPVGTAVTVNGTNFTGASSVKFNGTDAAFSVTNDTTISATVPSGATTGAISVTAPGGTGTSSTSFVVTTGGGGGAVTFENAVTGSSVASATVATGIAVTAAANHLYLAAIAAKSDTAVVGVSGLGLTWTPVVSRCGARLQTGIAVWKAQGSPSGNGIVTATFASAPASAAIVVSRYSNVLATGNTTSANTLGVAGACSGGTDSAAYSFPATTAASNAVMYAAAAMRSRTHTPGAGFTERAEVAAVASSGSIASVAVEDKLVAAPPTTTVNGTFDGTVDWAVAAVEIRPTATSSSPTVTSFLPTSGVIGAAVTLSGSNFTGATDVKFNGTSAAFTVNTDAQISTTVPAGATTGAISVTGPGGTGTSATNFTVILTPSVTSFLPTSGSVSTPVTITGSHFTGAADVKFNGTSAAFTVDNDTQISTSVPAGATTGTIAVTNAAGTGTSASTFTVLFTPSVTSFSPTSGIVGAAVTITGTHFTGATDVKFNGTSAAFTVDNDTHISTTVPAGATTGAISVTGPGGTGTSATNFTVIITPSVTSFSPTSGPVGTSVTITGTHFTGATDVKFNGTSAAFTVDNDTQISTTVPAGATSGTIAVTNAGGTGTSASSFTVIITPSVTSFLPTSGVVGTAVTITGTHFTGATAVKFNTTSAAFTVDNDTQISTTVPAGATTGTIAVTNAAGTGASASNFTVIITPSVASFLPTSGPVGIPVTITGSHFTGATDVKFNGTSAAFTVDNDTQISTSVPAGATTGPISVSDAGGTGTSATSFTVIVTPSVTSFLPTSGGVGTSVTISGSHFTGTTDVKFNGTSAAFTVNTDGQISTSVPAGATIGPIAVTNAAGTGTSATNFTITPAITSVAPTSGVVGTLVTITGSHFTGATDVKFNGTSAAFTVDNDTQISTSVPAGATTGPISVSDAGGTGTSATSFTVIVTPSVTSFLPTSGGVGTPVTLSGSGFTGATDVKFNGTSAAFTVNTDAQISTSVPAGATTGPIAVTNAAGTGTSSTDFTVAAAPIAFEDVKTGTSTSSTTVSTAIAVTAVAGHLYLAAVAPKSYIAVTGVSGLGLTWTPVVVQCGARQQTGVAVWKAQGTPSGSGIVTATLAGVESAAVIAVARYSSVSATGLTTSANTLGVAGACSGGSDSNSYSFSASTGTANAVMFAAAARRNRAHTPGAGYTERVEVASGNSSNSAGIAIVDKLVAAAGATTVNGSFSANVDWAVAAVEIRPLAGGGPAAPTVTSFLPTSGIIGAAVTVTGTNFTGATSVKFNGTSAAFTVDNATQISTTVPSGATTGAISVTGPGGTGTSASNFTVILTPSVTSFLPTSGAVGAAVTVTGTHFTGATDVKFNGTSATFTVNNDTQISTTVPTGATTGPIAVTNAAGTGTSASNFTVTAPPPAPTVTSFVPTSGAVGASVTVTGTNFTGATSVTFNGTSATFSVDSATQISTSVPSGATTGPISVTTPGGTGTSASNFTVTGGGGSITFQDVTTGASTTTSVATSSAVTAAAGHLYLAAISIRSATSVTSVSGLGLTWTPVVSQCAARDQTRVSVWKAQGTPSGSGVVTATLASSPTFAVIAVSRYSSVAATGATRSANTLGVSGACIGGIDSAAYSFTIPTTASNALVYTAAAMRNRTHSPGAGYTERAEVFTGTSGSMTSLAVSDTAAPAPSSVTVDGTFSATVDWAVAAVELQP